ncbi:ER lumen protein-retaining receptor [Diplonema papillatum]|nr:ER lumen protein-retaining receptor [Diplonema papillatum]
MELFGHTNLFRQVGDILHLLSVLIILYKMLKLKNCTGLSLKSQFTYAIVFTTRYVPSLIESRTVYLLVMKVFFLSTSWFVVYLMRFKVPYAASYDPKIDSFKMRYLFIVSGILAVFFHYDTPHLVVDILWTFSEYLEAVAILPQLLLLNTIIEQGRKWEVLTANYVLCLGMYRLFYVFNWIYRFAYENRWNWVDTTAGIMQTLLYADFFYIYIIGMSKMRQTSLPH